MLQGFGTANWFWPLPPSFEEVRTHPAFTQHSPALARSTALQASRQVCAVQWNCLIIPLLFIEIIKELLGKQPGESLEAAVSLCEPCCRRQRRLRQSKKPCCRRQRRLWQHKSPVGILASRRAFWLSFLSPASTGLSPAVNRPTNSPQVSLAQDPLEPCSSILEEGGWAAGGQN